MLAAGCIKPRTPTIHAAIGDSCQPFTRPLVTALETFALLLFRIHYVTFRLIASSLAVWPTTCALHHRVQHVTLTVTLTALRAIDHEAKTTALAHTNPSHCVGRWKKLITKSEITTFTSNTLISSQRSSRNNRNPRVRSVTLALFPRAQRIIDDRPREIVFAMATSQNAYL